MTFKPGNTAGFKPGQGGRQRGAKNRLSHAFLSELAADFEKFGAAQQSGFAGLRNRTNISKSWRV